MDELKTKLHWLIALRVVAVTLLLGLSLAFQVAKGERVPTFYGLILFTYLATIVYSALLRYLQGDRALTIFAWCQVSIDLILETILVATTSYPMPHRVRTRRAEARPATPRRVCPTERSRAPTTPW